MPPLRFLGTFAWADLTSPRSRLSTSVNVLTIGALYCMGLVTYGVFVGHNQIAEQRLAGEPLALCLRLGRESPEEDRINDAQIQSVDRELRDKLGDDRYIGTHPFRYERIGFAGIASPNNPSNYLVVYRRGRTIVAGDPIASKLRMVVGRTFFDAAEPGLLVSTSLLTDLGYPDPQSAPPDLRIVTPIGSDLRLKVVGVLQDRLPNGDYFLINDEYRRSLVSSTKDFPAHTVSFGPLPNDWPKFAALSDDLKRMFSDESNFRMYPPTEKPRSGVRYWNIRARGDTLNVSAWNYNLRRVHSLVSASPNSQLPPIEPIGVDPPQETDDDRKPHCAGAYFSELKDFETAGQVCSQLKIAFDPDLLEQYRRLSSAEQDTWWLIAGVFAVLGLLGVLNLGVSQMLIARQKTGAIGMLKAIGLRRRALFVCFALETTMICLVTMAVAVPLVYFAGPELSRRILDIRSPAEASLSFPVGVGALLTAVAAAWGLCLGAVLIAVCRYCLQSPLKGLSEGS